MNVVVHKNKEVDSVQVVYFIDLSKRVLIN